MEYPKDLEFLATKSKELIDKQVSSYRQRHSNAGSIIAVIALFTPFFLSGLKDAYKVTNLLSTIPVALFVYAVYLMLFEVLRSRPLDQGFGLDKFEELVSINDYEQVLLYEIGANISSFKANRLVTDKANRSYNRAIRVHFKFSLLCGS